MGQARVPETFCDQWKPAVTGLPTAPSYPPGAVTFYGI